MTTHELDAQIHQSLRASFGNKYPSRAVRRQLLERAAEQRSNLRRLSLVLSEWLAPPQIAFGANSAWHYLDYIAILATLGRVGLPYSIR